MAKIIQNHIFKITHKASGMYVLSVSTSPRYAPATLMDRMNQIQQWLPNRRFDNYAMVYFCKNILDQRLGAREDDFIIEQLAVEGISGWPYRQRALNLAKRLAHEFGTDKLLSQFIVSKPEWILHQRAVELYHPEGIEKKTKIDPTKLSALETEKRGYTVEMFCSQIPLDQDDCQAWQLLATINEYRHPVLMTRDMETVLAACNDAKRYCVVTTTVELRTEQTDRSISFIHLGTHAERTLLESSRLVMEVVEHHTPQTVYSYYL